MAYYPRLRDLREDKDLSIRELAEKLHIQRTTYHNYETGKRELPFDLAIKIAEFVRRPPSELRCSGVPLLIGSVQDPCAAD